MSDKAQDALKTISEVAALLDVPPHVLRFWEGKFTRLRPLKRSGGRRYYRPDDITLLRHIRKLLYVDGFTIKGAQKLISSRAFLGDSNGKRDDAEANTQALTAAIAILDEVEKRLATLKQKLDSKMDNPVV